MCDRGTWIKCSEIHPRHHLLPPLPPTRKVALSVAGSSLTKAAIYGHDPNWGRIAAAAG